MAPKIEQRFIFNEKEFEFQYQVIAYLPPSELWYWLQTGTPVNNPTHSYDDREFMVNDAQICVFVKAGSIIPLLRVNHDSSTVI